MNRIILTVSALIFVLAAESSAQLADTDTLPLNLSFNQSFFYSSGNVERMLSISQADLVHADMDWGFKTSNVFYYGTFARKKSEEDLYSRNFLYISPRADAYPYIMFWYERNLRQKLNGRVQAGPGVSFSVIRKNDLHIKLSLTATGEFNNYFVQDVREQKILRTTGRIYCAIGFQDSQLSVTLESYYQQNISFDNDFRSYTEVLFRFPVSEKIFLRTSVTHRYDNKVPANVKKQDVIISAGAGLNIGILSNN